MQEQIIKQTGKEIFEFVKELVFSPIQTILKNHDFSWKQMGIYFGSVSLTLNILVWIVSGGFRYGFVNPIQMTISQVVLNGILLFVTCIWLKKKGIEIEEREFAQIWMKAEIFGIVVGSPTLLMSIGVGILVGFVTSVIAGVVLVKGSYQYFLQVKKVEETQAKKAATLIAIAVFSLPILSVLAIGGLGSLLFLGFR